MAGCRFELVTAPTLLQELYEVLHDSKIQQRLTEREIFVYFTVIQFGSVWLRDPPILHALTPDPDDDYLIVLARAAKADFLASGDAKLLT